jgi:hypothetical protein
MQKIKVNQNLMMNSIQNLLMIMIMIMIITRTIITTKMEMGIP